MNRNEALTAEPTTIGHERPSINQHRGRGARRRRRDGMQAFGICDVTYDTADGADALHPVVDVCADRNGDVLSRVGICQLGLWKSQKASVQEDHGRRCAQAYRRRLSA